MFPNPASNFLTIVLPNDSHNSKFTIEIYTLLGRSIHTTPIINSDKSLTLPIDNLASGFYYLRILSDNGATYKAKFLKN
jgi:hypothetical protein